MRTNNRLNTHTCMTPCLVFEPGLHWWEASAVTTAPSLFLNQAHVHLMHLFLKLIPYLSNLDPTNIAKEFATGYLLGELLNKHGLQEDFSFFSQNM